MFVHRCLTVQLVSNMIGKRFQKTQKKTLTRETCMVKHTDRPTLSTMTTAGMADSFTSINVIAPTNCMRTATALKTISTAAQPDNSRRPTQMNVAHSTHSMISDKYNRRSIYCSQKMNGIPDG